MTPLPNANSLLTEAKSPTNSAYIRHSRPFFRHPIDPWMSPSQPYTTPHIRHPSLGTYATQLASALHRFLCCTTRVIPSHMQRRSRLGPQYARLNGKLSQSASRFRVTHQRRLSFSIEVLCSFADMGVNMYGDRATSKQDRPSTGSSACQDA
jgi:hypothetical protein